MLEKRTLLSCSCLPLTSLGIALTLLGCGDSDASTDGDTVAGSETAGPTESATLTITATGSSSGGETTAGPDPSGTDSESASSTGEMTGSSTTTSPTTDPVTTDPGTTTGTTGMEICPQGEIICEDGEAKICDGMGGFEGTEACSEECADGIGCVACIPGEVQCVGDWSQVCNDDGSAWMDDEFCDALQGVMCDENLGDCVGACSESSLGLSYIGCDYYPTVTAGLHETNPWVFDYAVVVANTTDQTANITITRGGMMVTSTTVDPDSVSVVPLPFIDQLLLPNVNTPGPSALVPDGAYRLRSDQPVTVYQYNPLQYQVGNSFSYVNDAGLLLPVNTWRNEYRVVSRNHWPIQGFNLPGFYAVIAREDGTTVTVTPSATGGVVNAGGGIAANGTGQVMLDAGDVLEVLTAPSGNGNPNPSDLTGTHVLADKPIQVIGGHKCTNIPWNIQYCDRLEESMVPIDAVGFDYLVSPPLIPTGGNQPKAQMVRVVAIEDNTTITYDPPQNGAPTMLANAGDYFEIDQTANDFQIVGDKKIMVAQYMLGQLAGGNSGDPAMTMAVPTEQFRSEYLVHAPTNYQYSYANIIAPDGATVDLDGMAVNQFTPIGNSGYGIARVTLSNAGDGNHLLSSDQKFGISVYGYGQYTSYWYPGGLDLKQVLE